MYYIDIMYIKLYEILWNSKSNISKYITLIIFIYNILQYEIYHLYNR